MRFKRDFDGRGGFGERRERLDQLWAAYMRPWDTMANVTAINCEPAVLAHAERERAAAVRDENSRRLMAALDPVALRVKRDLDRTSLPAFVDSQHYVNFVRERFPARRRAGNVSSKLDAEALVDARRGATKLDPRRRRPSASPSAAP
jgi:hypothetical protein